MAVAIELAQILADLNNITGILNNLSGAGGQATLITAVNTMFQQMLAQFAIVETQTQQNYLLSQSILAKVNALEVEVLSALGTPQQANQPVTLPTDPPPAYGGPAAPDIATAVWSWLDFTSTYNAYQALDAMFNLAVAIRDEVALPVRVSSCLTLTGDLFNPSNFPWPDTPEISPSTILPTDANILAWLTRVAPEMDWRNTGPSGLYWAPFGTGGSNLVTCTLTPAQFAWFRAANGGIVPGTNAAPVWPGLANVTLGAAHAMVPPGESIATPCDGVIIAITGVPTWAGNFSFGSAISWRNVGAVTFTSDNGQEEFAQTFSWSSGVYLPKAQTHAAGYAYRASLGVSGTITPFTIN